MEKFQNLQFVWIHPIWDFNDAPSQEFWKPKALRTAQDIHLYDKDTK